MDDRLEKVASVLTELKRSKMKKKDLGLPQRSVKGEPGAVGTYPMPDKKHAAVAKAFAKRNLARGRLTQEQYDQIVAKANEKLGTVEKTAEHHDRSPAMGALHGFLTGTVGGVGGAAVGASLHRAIGGTSPKRAALPMRVAGKMRHLTHGRMAAIALGGLGGAYAMRSLLKEKDEPMRHGATISSAVMGGNVLGSGLVGAIGFSGKTKK